MTYDHYLALRAHAKSLIEAEIAARQARAGNGAVVDGRLLSITPPEAEIEAAAETWQLAIWARLWVEVTREDGTENTEIPFGEFVSMPRIGGLLSSYLFEDTQLYELEDRSRRVKMELRALDAPPGRGRFRLPLWLTLAETNSETGEVLSEHRIRIGASGAVTRQFQASRPGVFTELRPARVELA